MKRVPIDIIIPDTGPLITLAVSDRLDLLQTFGRRILVTDVVQKECTAKPTAPGAEELADWLKTRGANQFQTLRTPLGSVYDQLALEGKQSGKPATHGLGEASITWTISNLERFAEPHAITLVLLEDARAEIGLPTGIHILSTRSWLLGLEKAGLLNNRQMLTDNSMRKVSPYGRDQPAALGPGRRSDWAIQTKAQMQDKAVKHHGRSRRVKKDPGPER